MKTNQKKEYVSPQIDVILIELEEGIAQTSTVTNTTPQVNDFGDGGTSRGWSDDQF